jgi:hypothetical protein
MDNTFQGWTLIRWDADEETLTAEHYESQKELLVDCEQNEFDTNACFVFKGKVEPMGLASKLAIVELEDEKDDEKVGEDTSEESEESNYKKRFVF